MDAFIYIYYEENEAREKTTSGSESVCERGMEVSKKEQKKQLWKKAA